MEVNNGEESDSEYEEEEAIILVELNGIIDTNFLLEKPEPTKILGIDTERPILQLGHYIFAGEYEDTMGTLVAFKPVEKKNDTGKEDKEYEYFCKTDKKLSMKRIFLQEKGKDLSTNELTEQEICNLVSIENSNVSENTVEESIEKQKSKTNDNDVESTLSNSQLSALVDTDITETMEFCLDSLIPDVQSILMNGLYSDMNLPNDLLVSQSSNKDTNLMVSDEDKNSKATEFVELDAPSFSEVKNHESMNTIESTDLKKYFNKHGLKRKRLIDEKNAEDAKQDLKISQDVIENILENVDDVNKEHEVENIHSTENEETDVVASAHGQTTDSSKTKYSENESDIRMSKNDTPSESRVKRTYFGRRKFQSKIDDSLHGSESSPPIYADSDSSVLEETPNGSERVKGDTQLKILSPSVRATSAPYHRRYQAAESSTDKATSPSQHEWDIADDDKCSSSGDMKLLSNNSTLSLEISQSSDPKATAISIASSSSRESSECEVSHMIEEQEQTDHVICEVSQSSRNVLISQIAEPSVNEESSSGWVNRNETSGQPSESMGDPCMSSDDIDVVHDQSEPVSNAGRYQCEVSQSKNQTGSAADSVGNISNTFDEYDPCGQSDDPTCASSPDLSVKFKDLCASSDDVVVAVDNSETQTAEQESKSSICEVSQSSKSGSTSDRPCDGNNQYDFKDTSECEVYGQPSDNTYEPSVIYVIEEPVDLCASSDDVAENFCEVTDTDRSESTSLNAVCEVTQSSEEQVAVPDDQEDDSESSSESSQIQSQNTVCKVTQSTEPGAEVSEYVENERGNSNESSMSGDIVYEVTQSSKNDEEMYIIVDEIESSENEQDDVECEEEITQSSKSGDAGLVLLEQESAIDEGQCSSECDVPSVSSVCQSTQSFQAGDDVFVVPITNNSVGDEGSSSNLKDNAKSSFCEVSQSSKADQDREVLSDSEDSNECEVYSHTHNSNNEQDESQDSAEDPCESSDDIRLLSTSPTKKTSVRSNSEGECSSSSKLIPNVFYHGDQHSMIDSNSNQKNDVIDLSDNEAGNSQESMDQGRSLHCESSTPASTVSVSSSSSVGTSKNIPEYASYSASGVVSDSSQAETQNSPVEDENSSSVQHTCSLTVKSPPSDDDHLIDSSSSSSSIEVIQYESSDTVYVSDRRSVETSHHMHDSPVCSSALQCSVSSNEDENSSSYVVQVSNDSDDVIEVESSTSKPNEEYDDQVGPSGYRSDAQFIDEEVEIIVSSRGSPNKDKCSSSYADSISTSEEVASEPINSSEAISSRSEDPCASTEEISISNAEIEIVCDSKTSEDEDDEEESCEIVDNSSNEASSSNFEAQESINENRPSLLEVIVSSASDFRNSLIHENSGFVRNNVRNLLVDNIAEPSSSKIRTTACEFPESLTNEAVGFSRDVSEKTEPESRIFFMPANNQVDYDNIEAEVSESTDSEVDLGMDLTSHSRAGSSSQHQVSQSSEIVNTDSTTNRIQALNASKFAGVTLQRDFVQSSTSVSHVSTMSNDSFGSAEQVTSAEENIHTGQFYESLPHEVPGSSGEIGPVPSESGDSCLESVIISHSDPIESSSENPTLFEANLSLYQKIEAVETEVSSSPCHDQAHRNENKEPSEVEIIEMDSSELDASFPNSQNSGIDEHVASTTGNHELNCVPPVVEAGESSTGEVTASQSDKVISSYEELDSPLVESNNPSCEVSESLSHRYKSTSSERSDAEVDEYPSCSAIGSTTEVRRFRRHSSSSSSSLSVIEVERDGDSKSSANEADVLSPDLVIETNDSESLSNEEAASQDLYICESSKSSENNSKNSSVCEVTESCTAEQSESSDSFTNDSKVSSYSTSRNTVVQRADQTYNENEFSALSSHEAVAKSFEVFPSEGQSVHVEQPPIEVVSQSTPTVELSIYEHVADFESDSVQSSSYEATQFSVNEQIKAISSPAQFSNSSSEDGQPQINTNPFIAPDGEYIPSENCDLSGLGTLPPHASVITHASSFQVCTFPTLMSSTESASMYQCQVPVLPTESLPPFDIRASTVSNFSTVSVSLTGDNFCPPERVEQPVQLPSTQFLGYPQEVYQYEVEAPETAPVEIQNVAYESLVESSEEAVSGDTQETDVPSNEFKAPSSTSN